MWHDLILAAPSTGPGRRTILVIDSLLPGMLPNSFYKSQYVVSDFVIFYLTHNNTLAGWKEKKNIIHPLPLSKHPSYPTYITYNVTLVSSKELFVYVLY